MSTIRAGAGNEQPETTLNNDRDRYPPGGCVLTDKTRCTLPAATCCEEGRTVRGRADYYRARGDHPHTDPDDGRTECDVCGKWVFEATHSCKRVPVTQVAWLRYRARITAEADSRRNS